ncbi:MAG: N-6 DNA methylase [Tannerella sp.]|jgi:hypothetical protein|nr:N-6 DNA methylase [Tannerella sp.]
MSFVDFFSRLDFDFNTNLKSETFYFEKELCLTTKLNNSVFFYSSPPQTNTSFYFITTPLNENEIKVIRKYIWNKNDADLIFLSSPEDSEIIMSYAKYSPTVEYKESILDKFNVSDPDLKKIEQIKRWQFDSGAFWLNYYSFIDKVKYKGIDKELITTLNALKDELDKILHSHIQETEKRGETVQALIDRTLYIKYLEDKHIINSFFYKHYFKDDSLNYEKLLNESDERNINEFFKIIHDIFSNQLFDKPDIEPKYITPEICKLIATSFRANLKTGQLRLFDFQFDVLPIEFISSIYEIFLTDEQKKNGIYYTPKKLAQLIVDDVIVADKIGSILDPSCGSGMFLVIGYQRLLEIEQKQGNEPEDSIDKIKFRMKLLKENIFGIEKKSIAQRFTLFSLSLQIFKDIPPQEIKEFIKHEIKQHKKINLFSEYNFYENILCQNTLDVQKLPFGNIKFDYIVGNPPFFEIKRTDEEISFLENYDVHLENEKTVKAKYIIGAHQISQCFFLKLKDWSNADTRFGFVSNSSNFYNDNSDGFQKYFYTYYGIEKIYELSRVKKILFEKAKESVVILIFSNEFMDNMIKYYPVDMGLFSEKPFELLIIEEDKAIGIKQRELQNRKVKLRNYLVGNEFDNRMINQLNNLSKLQEYIYSKNNTLFLHRGIDFVGFKEINKEFGINKSEWDLFSQQQRNEYYEKFKNQYTSKEQTPEFNIPFIKPASIEKFKIHTIDYYLGDDISMFQRPRPKELYKDGRIVLSRIGKTLKAVYLNEHIYFDFDLYVLKLKNEDLYYLIIAILNSDLINFYINIHLKKRIDAAFPKIGMEDIKKIPIPEELDEDLVTEISKISKNLVEGKFEYSEKEHKLNELIFDLYDLSYIDKQRIKDYFLKKKTVNRNDLKLYSDNLEDSIQTFFKNPIQVETYSELNLIIVKIVLNKQYFEDYPSAKKTALYVLNEIFKQNPNENYLAGQEKIFGEYCVYIIKKDLNTNWTETKAFEDGQDILKRLIDFKNGKRERIR